MNEPKEFEITHFSTRVYRNQLEEYPSLQQVPYIKVNIVWKVVDGIVKEIFKGLSDEYVKVIQSGTPEEEDAKMYLYADKPISEWPEATWVWTHGDPIIIYLEKFDIFQYHDYIMYNPVTLAILEEIILFKKTGKFGRTSRVTDASIFKSHIQALSTYWD